jgi:hypothetical protein
MAAVRFCGEGLTATSPPYSTGVEGRCGACAVEILFVIVPVFIGVVFIIILVQIGKQVAEWAVNNRRPVLSVPARVVTKRSATSGNVSQTTGGHVSTAYYATFELETGERKEFSLYGKEYGLLAEGDDGILTYQGTRYHGFERSGRSS